MPMPSPGPMLRYAEKLGGLYSKCDKATIKVGMIVDALVTVILEFSKTVQRRVAKRFLKEVVPRYVGAIDKMYSKEKDPYLTG